MNKTRLDREAAAAADPDSTDAAGDMGDVVDMADFAMPSYPRLPHAVSTEYFAHVRSFFYLFLLSFFLPLLSQLGYERWGYRLCPRTGNAVLAVRPSFFPLFSLCPYSLPLQEKTVPVQTQSLPLAQDAAHSSSPVAPPPPAPRRPKPIPSYSRSYGSQGPPPRQPPPESPRSDTFFTGVDDPFHNDMDNTGAGTSSQEGDPIVPGTSSQDPLLTAPSALRRPSSPLSEQGSSLFSPCRLFPHFSRPLSYGS